MITNELGSFVQGENLIGKRIGVAVSGGADSVSLFIGLAEIAPKYDLDLGIVHVNYQLRQNESDREQRFVEELATQYNIPIFIKNDPIDKHSSAIEEIARKSRYSFFSSLIPKTFDYIAVGHTLEDQAETVLFRLVRGTGVYGASGMEAIRSDGIIRPLLSSKRDSCREFLKSKGIEWCEDSSNNELIYTRNVIRHEIMPLLRSINSETELHLAQFASQARELSRGSVNRGMVQLRSRNLHCEDSLFHFQSGELCDDEMAAVIQLLRERECEVSKDMINRIRRAGDRRGKTTLLAKGWLVYRMYRKLLFCQDTANPFIRIDSSTLSSDHSVVRQKLYKIPRDVKRDFKRFCVRTVHEEDCFKHNGQEKKILSYLKKKGVPERERKHYPLFFTEKGTLVFTLP